MLSDKHNCSCTVNEAEMFNPIPKQIILEKGMWVDSHPLNNVSSDGPIEFIVNGSTDELIDLNNTLIHIRAKIVNANGDADLKATDVVAPVNNWLHSMFSDVVFSLSGQVIEGGNHHYPYKAYLTNLLTHNRGSKSNQLQASGWFKDTAEKMNAATTANKGFTKRKTMCNESKTVEMCGPLILDSMLQNQYLVQKTDIGIKLHRAKPEFQAMIKTGDVTGKATTVKVIIEHAVLYMRRVKVLASYINDIEEKLNFQNTLYQIQRTEMVTYTIPQGSQSHSKESLFRGQMPKLVLVGFVRNDAYNGSYVQNPYDFANFNLNHLALYREGESIPFRPYVPDYGNNFYVREYMSLMQALEIYNRSEDIDLSMNEFANGYGIYGFNLTPDLSVAGHAQTTHDGNVRLEVQFDKALETTVNVIVMGIFDGQLEITKQRNVHMSWKS